MSVDFSAGSEIIHALTQSMRRIFDILLPITFPITSSALPFKAENIFTASSGAEVPNATTVKPTTREGIPYFRARDEAHDTNISAHLIRNGNHRRNKIYVSIVILLKKTP